MSESDRESFKKCQPEFPLRVVPLKYSEIQLKMELNIGMHLEFYETLLCMDSYGTDKESVCPRKKYAPLY